MRSFPIRMRPSTTQRLVSLRTPSLKAPAVPAAGLAWSGGFDMGTSSGPSAMRLWGRWGRRRSPAPARPRSTVRTSLTLTLEEAAFGCEKDVNIQHVRPATSAAAPAASRGPLREICPECHGSGQVRGPAATVFGTTSTSTVCPNCRGRGKIIHQKAGLRRQRRCRQKKVHIKVPAGTTMARPSPSEARPRPPKGYAVPSPAVVGRKPHVAGLCRQTSKSPPANLGRGAKDLSGPLPWR